LAERGSSHTVCGQRDQQSRAPGGGEHGEPLEEAHPVRRLGRRGEMNRIRWFPQDAGHPTQVRMRTGKESFGFRHDLGAVYGDAP